MDIHPFQVVLKIIESWAMSGGYAFLFLVSILEALPFIGTTIPGHTVVILSGFLARIGILNIWIIIIIASLGATIGDSIGYYSGRKYGLRLIERFRGNFFFKDKYITKTQGILDRHTGKAIVLGRFNPVTRSLMPFVVGANNIREKKFWFFNILGALLWSVSSILVGYIFGIGYEAVAHILGRAIIVVFVLAIIAIWGYRFINNYFHVFKRYELFSLILSIISFFGLLKTAEDAWSPQSFMANIDIWINNFMALHVTPFLASLAKIISDLGGTVVLGIVALLVVIYLFYKRKFRFGMIMVFSMGGTAILVELAKAFFMRVRPENALLTIINDPSFPSGHASIAAAFFTILIYLFAYHIEDRKKRDITIVVCIILTFLIGLSRLILNVHWFSDVVAGWSLGIFVATVSILVVRYISVLLRKNR